MKKILCILMLLLGLQLQATDYNFPYLILTTGSGSQVALAVDGLEMTFEDGKLVAKNTNGSTSLTLADLTSMQFSQTNGGIVDGISAATAAGTGGSETFYDLSGRRAYRQGSTVRKGIYVMRKANGETSKILVK